ncbi:MAG: ABC transporter substrate-binding protein [Candidatus Thermoplasmatota archaeon]|nr:ABC transporter substrate-binding protein [Candidatus Thermoplasmatota archaeon]
MKVARRLSAFLITAIMLLLSLNIGVSDGQSETRQDITLKVAVKADMAMSNILAADDVWTRGALFPVYMTVGVLSPDFSEICPYVLKGVDADDSGVLDPDEYGVFTKEDGLDPRAVTAYYDLNGVHFHDGVQATKEDLLFSYHVESLLRAGDVFGNSLDVLKDESNQDATNYTSDRWLWVYPVSDIWNESVPVGQNDDLTFALHFELQSDYFGFVDYTLSHLRLYPRYLWEGTGKHCLVAQSGVCSEWEVDIHENFGRAYDPATENGVPASSIDAFNVTGARSWVPGDRHIIGTGPFEFVEWVEGSTVRLDRYEDFHTNVADRDGDTYLRKPHIESILFKIYKTVQSIVWALQAGEVDVTSMVSIPPEFFMSLWPDPNIDLTATPSKGPFYLGYNMRESPFGYPDNDPSQGDDGYHLRKAIAHAIDKRRLVTTHLLNFAVAGDQPVSPAFTNWYNASVTKYDYDLDLAGQILDDHYTIGGFGLGWSDGWRNLPGIGDDEIEIITYLEDFEPRCHTSAKMIASDMRKIGLNVSVKLLAHGEVAQRVADRTIQMWLLPEEINSEPLDYYYELFYSGKARDGRNDAGFQNEAFDQLVLQARSEFNVSEQMRLIKEASGLLADALPIDVLFYRTNIEAYRSDRFINWTAGLTGSHIRESFWTLIGIHPPFVEDMSVTITAPSAMEAMSAKMFRVLVQDFYGVLSDVRVDICISAFVPWRSGNITLGEKRGLCVSGVTDINGAIVAVYEAPDVGDLEKLTVAITADAKSGYRISETATTYITIFPREKQFLSVEIQMEAGDVVPIGYSLPLRVEVTDQKGVHLDGVTVNLTCFPEGLVLEPSTGTTVGGFIKGVIVESPSVIGEGIDYLRFNIIANVELEEYESGMGMAEIVVVELSPAQDPPMSGVVSSDIQMLLIVLLLSTIVILGLIRVVRGLPPEYRRGRKK